MSNNDDFFDNSLDENAGQTPVSPKDETGLNNDIPTNDNTSETSEPIEPSVSQSEEASQNAENKNVKPKKKFNTYQFIRILCAVGFIVFAALFVNEVLIQPYRINKVNDYTKDLFNKPSSAPTNTVPTQAPATDTPDTTTATPTPDPNRDEQGRLIYFKDLLAANPDTKGWINFPDTNIDNVVMQRKDDSLYYLNHDFNGDILKAGCLFLDAKSSVENNTKNMVIHGHNMKSTDNMFHYLEHMKKLDYFKVHTTFTFDTIYQSGQWKIVSIFITNGSDKKEPFFDYTKSTFKDSSDFMNFVYQLRIRSMFNIDTVDINEEDQILTLSTCSYEINNYRLVVVARKVRPGEDATVDAESITKNKSALYPQSYNDNYKIEAPTLPATFEEAVKEGTISWYKPVDAAN